MKTLLDLKAEDLRRLKNHEAEVLMLAMLTDLDNEKFDEDFANEIGFPAKVLYQRMNTCTNITISKAAALYMVQVSEGNPGNIVMWVFTMHQYSKTANQTHFTTKDIVDLCPGGVPTEIQYAEIWDSQKDGGANKLDMMETWR